MASLFLVGAEVVKFDEITSFTSFASLASLITCGK